MQRERRTDIRQRVDRGGLISFDPGRSTLPCRLSDYLAGGARVTTDDPEGLPDTLTLYFDAIDPQMLEAVAVQCVVVRRSAGDFAVRFSRL